MFATTARLSSVESPANTYKNQISSSSPIGRLRLGFWLPCIAAMVLAACAETKLTNPTFVNSRDEAGAVLISATMVAPWQQVSDAMAPSFTLANADAALTQVAPVTDRITEQVLRAFGLSLGIGLPQSTSTSATNAVQNATENVVTNGAAPAAPPAGTTTTSTTSNGSTSTTTTTNTAPGVAPTPPTGVPAGGQLPASPTGTIDLDPILKYQAAQALYQSVQLMNREVQYAAALRGYVPYVVQLKLAVMPYRPNLPYDVHAQISFFLGCGNRSTVAPNFIAMEEASPVRVAALDSGTVIRTGAAPAPPGGSAQCPTEKQPQVVPLLVTDDIERAMKSRAVETARQVAIALSGMINNVGGNLGVNNLSQTLNTSLGQDINSRLTVSRLADNTLYARIGATESPSSGKALVGQTYNISVLLLIPKEYADQTKSLNDTSTQAPTIQIASHTDFRNAITGQVLPTRTMDRLRAQAREALIAAFPQKRDIVDRTWRGMKANDQEQLINALIAPVQEGAFNRFEETVGSRDFVKDLPERSGTPAQNLLRRAQLQFLWTRLTPVVADSAFKSAFFELPQVMPAGFTPIPAPPSTQSASLALPTAAAPSTQPAQTSVANEQPVTLFDDKKDKMTVQVQGVRPPVDRGFKASIALSAKGGPHHFPAQSIVFDQLRQALTLTFDSPVKWGLTEYDASKSTLIIDGNDCAPQAVCPTFGQRTFKLTAVQLVAQQGSGPGENGKEGEKAPRPSFTFSTPTNHIAREQNTRNGSVDVMIDKLDKAKEDSVTIAVKGAGIISATNASGKAVAVADGVITIKDKMLLTIQMKNLNPEVPVIVEAEGHKGEASTGKIALQFQVLKDAS